VTNENHQKKSNFAMMMIGQLGIQMHLSFIKDYDQKTTKLVKM